MRPQGNFVRLTAHSLGVAEPHRLCSSSSARAGSLDAITPAAFYNAGSRSTKTCRLPPIRPSAVWQPGHRSLCRNVLPGKGTRVEIATSTARQTQEHSTSDERCSGRRRLHAGR